MFGSVLMCKRCWLKQQPKKRVRTRTQGLVGSWPLSSPHGWSSSPRLRNGVSASGPSPPHPFLGAPLPSPSRLGWVSRPGQFQTGSKGCSPLSTHHPLSRGTWIPSAEEEGLGPQPHSQAPGEPRLGVWGRGAWWSVGTGMRPVSASLPRADLDLRTSGHTGCLSAPLWPRRLPGASLPALGPCSEAGSLPSIWPWPRGVRGRAPVRGWRGVQIWSTARPWALAAPARSPTPTASDGRRAVSGARGAGSRGQGGGVGRRAPEIREWSRDGAPRVQV